MEFLHGYGVFWGVRIVTRRLITIRSGLVFESVFQRFSSKTDFFYFFILILSIQLPKAAQKADLVTRGLSHCCEPQGGGFPEIGVYGIPGTWALNPNCPSKLSTKCRFPRLELRPGRLCLHRAVLRTPKLKGWKALGKQDGILSLHGTRFVLGLWKRPRLVCALHFGVPALCCFRVLL